MKDPDEFAQVYEREARMVLLYVARRVLDGEVALDITAEAFAQAFCARRSFRGSTDAELRAWLLTIARRQISRYLRRGAVERRALRKLGASVPVVHDDDLREIEESAELAQLRETIGSELDRLSGDQRDALRLRVVDERPYDEVAEMLGISEQTARSRVSRGLRALGRALEPDAMVRRS